MIVKTSPNKTPVVNDEYRDNFDRIFANRNGSTTDDMYRAGFSAAERFAYDSGWNDALERAVEVLAISPGEATAIRALKK